MKQPIYLDSRQHQGNHFFKQAWLVVLLTSLCVTGCLLFEQPPRVHEIALADLTGNGYLDAYVAIGYGGGEPYIHPDYILFNDGNGQVETSQEFIGKWPGNGVTLGDFNGNGLADVLLDIDGGGLVLYTNRGPDGFQPYSYRFSGPVGYLAWPGAKGVMWLALDQGSRDNISCIVMDAVEVK